MIHSSILQLSAKEMSDKDEIPNSTKNKIGSISKYELYFPPKALQLCEMFTFKIFRRVNIE